MVEAIADKEAAYVGPTPDVVLVEQHTVALLDRLSGLPSDAAPAVLDQLIEEADRVSSACSEAERQVLTGYHPSQVWQQYQRMFDQALAKDIPPENLIDSKPVVIVYRPF